MEEDYSVAAKATRSSQVDQTLNSVEKELAAQDELLSQLFVRLEAVCRPLGPQPGETDRESIDDLVPLAMRIKYSAERLGKHNTRLAEIIQRIEV